MSNISESKRWQARIWIGDKMDEPVIQHGASIQHLQENVSSWLLANKPLCFGNAHPSYEITRRYNYVRATGEISTPERWKMVKGEADAWDLEEHLYSIENVIRHFLDNALVIEKGADYQEVNVINNTFPLYLIRTVKREHKELLVNDMLQMGWYIIGLEEKEDSDIYDHTVSKTIIFLLGHPEENAIVPQPHPYKDRNPFPRGGLQF